MPGGGAGRRRQGGARLERIAGALDWNEPDALLAALRSASTGRPGWPALSMPKALLLAQWYGPSDPELEDALADRLRFRRFVRLPLDGGVPDGTTRCRFRGELARRRLTDRLLAAVDAPLVACGLVPRRGMLIDASLVEADADLRKGPDGRPVTAEREAGFATRRGKAFFGFKAHLAVDEGSGPVRRAILTPANVHESVVADVLPIGDEAAVCAAADQPVIPLGNHPGTVDRHSKTAFRRGLSDDGHRALVYFDRISRTNHAAASIRGLVARCVS